MNVPGTLGSSSPGLTWRPIGRLRQVVIPNGCAGQAPRSSRGQAAHDGGEVSVCGPLRRHTGRVKREMNDDPGARYLSRAKSALFKEARLRATDTLDPGSRDAPKRTRAGMTEERVRLLRRHPGRGAMRSVAPQTRACPRLDRGNQSTSTKCFESFGALRLRPAEIISALGCCAVIRPRV